MSRPTGFSLAELLACVAILAITMAMGLPALSTFSEQARTLNGFHALTASLMSARMAAISHGVPATVCPSADGLRCRDDLVWEQGWIVYLDPSRQPQPGRPDAVIWHVPAQGARLSIHATPGRHRVRYQPTGLSGGSNVTLRLCNGRPLRHVGDVVVNLAGRPRTRRQQSPEIPCPYRR